MAKEKVLYFNHPQGHIKDKIIIHDTPELPANGFYQLNGFPFQLPVNVEIDIPRPVRLYLDTLIRTEHRRVEVSPGVYQDNPRNVRRVVYTLVKENIDQEPPPPPPGIVAEEGAQMAGG